MLSTLDSAGPPEAEATRAEPLDPMRPLMLPLLVAGAMQPLTQMFATPGDDEPSDVVSQLLLLLLMESFLVSLGDPFRREPPDRFGDPQGVPFAP